VDWLGLNASHDIFLIFSTKRRLAAKHYVKYDSTAPNVAFFTILPPENFRSHVDQAANTLTKFFSFLKPYSWPKVDYFERITLIIVKHILRLEVSMAYTSRVHIVYPRNDLFEQTSCNFLCKKLIDFHVGKQITSLAKLHDDCH